MIEISLTKGQVAIVDDIDADLAELKWHVIADMRNPANPYYTAKRSISNGKGKSMTHLCMHRLIMERKLERKLEKDEFVDHINGNPLDNRRGNLRVATRTQNAQNRRIHKTNTSGFKGVSYNVSKSKWQSHICNNKQSKNLGYFDTPQEAYAAYCEAAVRLHGEFARLETAQGVNDGR